MRFLAALITVFLSIAAAAQQPFDTKAVDKIVTSAMKAWQIPGAAVAVVRNDRVVYVRGYGTKELGGTDPVTNDTLFQIASTSKAFTSTALAMLASDGKLSFDDPVRKHLDYFHLADMCADSQVTIRDILSHRTGLKRHDELWDNSPFTREDVVRRIGRVELTKPFRSGYQYQNIMYIAAGEVVAKASGMPWDDFVKTRIFQPLGMLRTVTSDADWNASTDRATGYQYDWKTGRISPQRPIDTTTIGAGGAIKSSAADMGNWLRFQLSNGAFNLTQITDPGLIEETKTPNTVIRMEGLTREANTETNVMSYAMGWVVQDYRGEALVSHAGALNGFRTHVDLLPRRNSGFVLMINVGRGLALISMRNSLADLLSNKPGRDWNAYYLMIDRRADEKSAADKAARDAKRVPDTTPSRPLEDYAGEYESPAYGTAKVSVVNGALMLQWSRMNIPLTHFHYDIFSAVSEYDDVDEHVTFTLNPEREVKTLTFFGERFTRKK
ncbi:MAG TPA: serine hydrolase [Thermoanaerobaculia bacterium]|nr:serine hydrolase [Thermoanaerobaculia bacterium]